MSFINVNYVEMLDESGIEPTHVHPCCEIYFCLENRLIMSAGNEEHMLDPGEFMMVMPGTPHHSIYNPSKKKKFFVMAFELPYAEDDDEQNHPFMRKVGALSKKELICRGKCALPDITGIVNNMSRELSFMQTGWLFLFRGYCLEFLVHCFRELIEPVNVHHREADNRNIAIEIAKYMNENYNKKITLNDIAKALFISPRHAQRIFKDFFGNSFANTLRQYRLNYAKNYLIYTDMSVEKIADELGLSSTLPLYKMFREEEGMSVSEYRSKQRENIAKNI
jgi:AraC-like DNA-binding protein